MRRTTSDLEKYLQRSSRPIAKMEPNLNNNTLEKPRIDWDKSFVWKHKHEAKRFSKVLLFKFGAIYVI